MIFRMAGVDRQGEAAGGVAAGEGGEGRGDADAFALRD